MSEYLIPLSDLCEVLSAHVGYDFLVYTHPEGAELTIFIPKDVADEDYRNIKRKIGYMSYRTILGYLKIVKIERETLKKAVYPYSHHKPHNIVEVLPPELQNF